MYLIYRSKGTCRSPALCDSRLFGKRLFHKKEKFILYFMISFRRTHIGWQWWGLGGELDQLHSRTLTNPITTSMDWLTATTGKFSRMGGITLTTYHTWISADYGRWTNHKILPLLSASSGRLRKTKFWIVLVLPGSPKTEIKIRCLCC